MKHRKSWQGHCVCDGAALVMDGERTMKRGLGYPRRGIRVKLFVSYVLITLPLLALALYFAREWSLQQRSLLTTDARQGAIDTALRLGSFFDRTGVTLSTIARHPAMRSGDPEEMAQVLGSLLPVIPRLSSLFVVDLDGDVLTSVPSENRTDIWVGDRDYFQAIAGGTPIYVSGGLIPKDAEAGRPARFVVALPIKDTDGRLLGVLVAGMHAAEIQQDMLPTLGSASASVFVVDQYDRVVLHPQQTLFGTQLNLAAVRNAGRVRDESIGTEVIDPHSGQTSPARVWPVSGSAGWSVVAIERIGGLQADDTRRILWVTSLALVALALSAASAVVLGGRLSGRVTRLSRAAALVAGGKLGLQVPVTGQDETAVLSRTFNAMSARLAQMVRQLDETRRSLQQSYAEVGQALTAGFEAEKTLALILRVVMSRLDVPAALVGRVDEDGRVLHWVAVAGPLEHQLMDFSVPLDRGAGLAARAVMDSAVVRGCDTSISLTPGSATGTPPSGAPSGLVAPLRVGGRVTGVIEILDFAGRSFDDEETASLLAFAESASLALDRAAHFAKTERQKLFVQSVLDSIPIAVGVVQVPTFAHELLNPTYQSMIGSRVDGQVHQADLELNHPSPVATAVRTSAQAAVETGAVQRLDDVTSGPGRHGSAAHWAITCSPLPDAVGRPGWVLVTGVETTEHIAARGEIESLARIAEHRAHELETVISSMTDGVMVVDHDGALVMVNEAARQIVGGYEIHPRVEDTHRLRRPCYRSGEPIPLDQMPRLRAARGEHFSNSEMVIHQPDGSERLLSISGAPLLGQDGQSRGGVCVFHDATEQRRRTARQRLLAEVSQLFNSSMDLDEVLHLVAHKTANTLGDWCSIHLLDDSGQYMHLRAVHHPDPELAQRAERILGGRPIRLDELQVGQSIQQGGPILIEKFNLDSLRSFARPLRGLARSKEEVATSFLAVPLQARGHVLGAMSVTCTGSRRQLTREDLALAVDLAERAALALDNARLYQQTEGERLRLQSIVDSLPEGIIVAEGDEGCITTANCVAESMWGRPIPPGTKLADLAGALAVGKPDADETQQMDLLNTISTGQTMLSYEATIMRPDGSTLDVLASSAPCWYGTGKGIGMVAVFQDITRIKGIERLKDEFLSITSHELRTPLTSLKGFAQFLLRRAVRGSGRDEDVQALQVINRQINRMVALVGDLLDVSRIEAGQVILSRQKFDLVALTRRVVKQAQVTAKRHRLKVEAVESFLEGWWDERRIEQVMANLLDNAVKYSPDGPIEVAIHRWDDEAVVSVRDHGAGLSKENQAHLFQRFYRGGNISTRSIGGLGLGLYICDQLVRCHGGRMWVDSEEGQGSTFWFALPVAAEDNRSAGGGEEEDGQYAQSLDCR